MPKILLVDDEQMNRDPLARRLTRRGYDVVQATNADQAVAMTRQERPDVVLMDIGLPGKTGYEATREIKADQTISATPVIALTGFAMEDERAKALSEGCDDYDTKPVELARLLQKIEALLGAGKT